MESVTKLCAVLLLVFCSCSFTVRGNGQSKTQFGRKSFPSDFVFGVGSASYQYAGAVHEEGGRGPSIWDKFSRIPGKIVDQSNGDVANDQYHRYKKDIKLLADMGVDSYRFSISWSCILPKGRGTVNKKGIAYYNNLIDELLKHVIEPIVTIFHWHLPQALQDEYGGFLSEKIVKDFSSYAITCFEAFGDRVNKWVTINELFIISFFGYGDGSHAPGHCTNCTAGDSATEPYIVAHNLLLAHSAVVKIYRETYKEKHKGSIGITLVAHWFIPYSNSFNDQKATRRVLDFYLGGFMDPLTRGKYPNTMQALVGDRLPHFTKAQSRLVKDSFDFIDLNYYTTFLCHT
ncbi:hypothetical protein SUGI_0285900 [Cryptomeria japonica]|nr:hypothetical protein SUGI_0285900 [Cryptomeria japonica]